MELLNILPCTEQPPQQRVILSQISLALLLRNSVGKVDRNIGTHLSGVHSSEKLEITQMFKEEHTESGDTNI